MSRKSDPSYRITQESPRGAGPVAHGIGVLLCLMGIVYFGLFFASRTSGFRVTVEERLEKRFGMPVSIRKASATPALNLRLEGLATRGSEQNGKPGVRAREVVLEWSLAGLVRPGQSALQCVTVSGGAISFAPGETGQWEPAALDRLGSWIAEWGRFQIPAPPAAERPDRDEEKKEITDETAKPPEAGLDWLQQATLDFREGRMTWWDAEGNERAVADGIGLTVTPVALPNRRITHVYLTLAEGRVGDRQVQNFAFELLKTREQDIALGMSGDWQTEQPEGPAASPD